MQQSGLSINESLLSKTVNVSDTVFQALQTGLVSYTDLALHLSLEDALNVIEVDLVAKHNKAVIEELK